MSNNDIDEFNPENDAPAEFNPYADKHSSRYDAFLEDEPASAVAPEGTGEAKPETEKKESAEMPADEDHIDLPDFMAGTASVSEFTSSVEKAEYNGKSEEKNEGNIQASSAQDFEGGDDYNPYSAAETAPQNQDAGVEINGVSPNAEQEAPGFNGSLGDGGVEATNGGNTEDVPEDIAFKPKVSAGDADKRPGSKPKVLNKKFILSVIIIVGGVALLITFLMPAKKKVNGKNNKPKAEIHHSTDYESLASRRPEIEEHYEDRSVEVEEETDEIPPVIIKDEKPAYTQSNINYNTGKGNGKSSIDIPDTRNDRLQGKSISGIKGLTSSQASYSTDYQQTLEKNSRSSSASTSYTLPSKEEYMNNVLGAYSQAYGNATSQNNAYAVQNDQAGKNSFYNNGRNAENVGQGDWLNLNTLWQGTIFEATLTSELNTDLPGEITARIAKNIYSSQDGRFLLIPQNSVVFGTYNSSISYSQNRVQVAWHTLIRPDGYQIQLGSMNGTDAKGASGLKGWVNDHPMAYLKAIGLMSVFSIVNSEFASQMKNTDNDYVQNLIANSQNVTMQLGEKLIDRAMNVQPTIKIKSGTKINIVVNHNLTLPPCENIPVTQPYHRQK